MSSKNKNNKFSNRAAKRFNDMSKVDVMSQDEIFILADVVSGVLVRVNIYSYTGPVRVIRGLVDVLHPTPSILSRI